MVGRFNTRNDFSSPPQRNKSSERVRLLPKPPVGKNGDAHTDMSPKRVAGNQPSGLKKNTAPHVSGPRAHSPGGAHARNPSFPVDPFSDGHDGDFDRYSTSQTHRDRKASVTNGTSANNAGSRQSRSPFEDTSNIAPVARSAGLGQEPYDPPLPATAKESEFSGGNVFNEDLKGTFFTDSGSNSRGDVTSIYKERTIPLTSITPPPATAALFPAGRQKSFKHPSTPSMAQYQEVFDVGPMLDDAHEQHEDVEMIYGPPDKTAENQPLQGPLATFPNLSTLDLESWDHVVLTRGGPDPVKEVWWRRLMALLRSIGISVKQSFKGLKPRKSS